MNCEGRVAHFGVIFSWDFEVNSQISLNFSGGMIIPERGVSQVVCSN